MQNRQTPPDSLDRPPPPESEDEPNATTRRAFLNQAGRKARYIAPLVLTVAFAPTRAFGSAPCVPLDGSCAFNSNCCAGTCQDVDPGVGEDWKCKN